MANLDKPLPVPGVFSVEDFQNLSSFSGAGKDNGFSVNNMLQKRTALDNIPEMEEPGEFSTYTDPMPTYGFSRKDISNVGGVTAMKPKDKNETYIPDVELDLEEDDPTLKDKLNKLKDNEIAKYAGIGATVGSVVPGLGTAIGAGLGALTGWGVKAFKRKKNK
tara:strand:+ start:374 stop:862 length:489 start_codon:yes stop_codon:yes gene_type:complete